MIDRRRPQRAWAELRWTLWGLRGLSRPFAGLAIVWALGAVVHHFFGAPPGGTRPPWSEAFFVSYNLLFLEHTAALPAHPVGVAVQYLQPLFGVFLLAEGLIKLGLTVFQKDHHQEQWMSILASSTRDHVLIVGLGTVGFRVLEELTTLGEQVFVVERDPECQFLDRARNLGADVRLGDARGEDVLATLNIAQARAVIVCTDDDLVNLEVAMDVREARQDIPIVLRLFDQRLARKVQASLGFQVTVSTSQVAAPILAAAALDPSVVGAHRLGETVLLVLEGVIAESSPFAGVHISEVVGAHRLTVVAHRPRDSEVWEAQPSAGVRLASGDALQVMLQRDRLDEVKGLLEAAQTAAPAADAHDGRRSPPSETPSTQVPPK